jgi:hypothetical protein
MSSSEKNFLEELASLRNETYENVKERREDLKKYRVV